MFKLIEASCRFDKIIQHRMRLRPQQRTYGTNRACCMALLRISQGSCTRAELLEYNKQMKKTVAYSDLANCLNILVRSGYVRERKVCRTYYYSISIKGIGLLSMIESELAS